MTGEASIYARRSKDLNALGKNVAAQVRDMRALAKANGDTISDDNIHVDNDQSASRFARRQRTEWKQLVAKIESGQVRKVYTLWLNRLLRIPAQLEHLIDLALAGKFESIITESMALDLRDPYQQQMARNMASQADLEAHQLSMRIKRRMTENRSEGKTTHGVVSFGWLGTRHGHAEDVGDTICEAEATLMRDAAARVLAGTTLTTIATEWNAAGVPMAMVHHKWVKAGSKGDMPASKWMPGHIQRLLLLPRNAGYQVHDGQVIGQPWPAILDADTYADLVAHFERRKYGPRAARSGRWTGFVRCAGLREDGTLCGATMLFNPARGKSPAAFACKRLIGRDCCGSNGVVEHHVQPMAYKWIVAHLDDKRMRQLSKADTPDTAALYAKLQKLNAVQAENEQLRGIGELSPAAFKRMSDANARAVADVSRQLAQCEGHVQSVMEKYLGRGTFVGEVLASGDMAADEHKQLFLSTGHFCWIKPAGGPGPFNPARVHFGETPPKAWLKVTRKVRDNKREAA